jgi:hypothetical protein
MRFVAFAAAIAAASCVALVSRSSSAAEAAEVVTGPNTSLLSSGVLTLGIPYAASVFVGVQSSNSADRNLLIPVAGPWIDLARRQGGAGDVGETTNKALLVGNGIIQGLGALQIAGALIFPETRVVRTRALELTIVPASVGGTSPGVAAFGRF